MIDTSLIVELGDGSFGVNCPVVHVTPNPQRASRRLYVTGASYVECRSCKNEKQRVRDAKKRQNTS